MNGSPHPSNSSSTKGFFKGAHNRKAGVNKRNRLARRREQRRNQKRGLNAWIVRGEQ